MKQKESRSLIPQVDCFEVPIYQYPLEWVKVLVAHNNSVGGNHVRAKWLKPSITRCWRGTW